MPRRYVLTTYEYNELDEKAKKKALDVMRTREMETGDHCSEITEMFSIRLAELGYPTDNICWALNYCQGDGVAFYGSIEVHLVIARLYKGEDEKIARIMRLWEEGSLNLKLVKNTYGHHYSHWNTMTVDDESTFAEESDIRVLMQEICKDILSDVKDTSRELEKMGYKELEHYTKDDVLIADAEANDDEFNKDGTFAVIRCAISMEDLKR